MTANYYASYVIYAGTSISHELSSDVPSCADVPNMPAGTMVESVDTEDLRDGQEHMENDEIVPPFPQRNNASFQVILFETWWCCCCNRKRIMLVDYIIMSASCKSS